MSSNFEEAETLQFLFKKISGRDSQNFHLRHFRIVSQLLGRQHLPTNGTTLSSQQRAHGKAAMSGTVRVPTGPYSCNYFVSYDFAGPDLGNCSE